MTSHGTEIAILFVNKFIIECLANFFMIEPTKIDSLPDILDELMELQGEKIIICRPIFLTATTGSTMVTGSCKSCLGSVSFPYNQLAVERLVQNIYNFPV